MKKNKNKNLGFTLIELMISMAMIAILSASALQIARFSDTQKNLSLATDEFRSAVRMAQSYSLSTPVGINTGQHVCGFGVRITGSRSYVVFYTYASDSAFENDVNVCDLSGSQLYIPTTSGVSTGNPSLESFNFSNENGVTVNATTNPPEVFFKSPYGDPTASRTFTISGGGSSRTISVTSSGQIN